jgi:hypothetical protein
VIGGELELEPDVILVGPKGEIAAFPQRPPRIGEAL